MAKIVVTGEYLALGAGPTDYSAQIRGATLTIDAPEVDLTNMASAGWSEGLGGIKKGTLAIEWVKDADLSGLTAAMNTALSGTLAFALRLQAAAASATNIEYGGTCVVTQWSPISGTVGQAFGGSTSWPTTGAITTDDGS